MVFLKRNLPLIAGQEGIEMKSFLSVALATTALIAAAPSFAQSPEDALRSFSQMLGGQRAPNPFEHDLNDRERRLTDMVEDASRNGRIDRRESDRMFNELREIRNQQDDLRGRHGQLTPGDHDYLRDRLVELDRQFDRIRDAGGPPPPPPEYDRGGGFWRDAPASFHERLEWIERRIRSGIDDRSLDRREAETALDQLRAIRGVEAADLRRGRGRINDADQADLDRRLEDLRRQVHWMREH